MAALEPTAPTLIQSISLGLGGYNKAFQLVGGYLLASPEAFIREPLQEMLPLGEVCFLSIRND